MILVVALLLRSLVAEQTLVLEDPGKETPGLSFESVRVSDAPDPAPVPTASLSGEIDPSSQEEGVAGREWTRLNNETAELLRSKAHERAVEGFRRCHDARPENDIFRRNLAEALARWARELHEQQKLAAAIAALEEVLELAPEREDHETQRSLLERWRAQFSVEQDHWHEGSDLFTLSFDTDRRDILHNSQDVLDHLEKSYEELRLWFGADPVREGGRRPIRVVLYDSDEFDHVTGLGDWAGGVFDGTVRVSVDDLRVGNWKATLKHELVHAFLFEIGGRSVPGWLNEGLAQLLENQAGEVDRARARLRRDGVVFELEGLEGSLVGWDDTQAISRAYAQTLVWADDLRANYGEEALRRMVHAAGEGQEVGVAFEEWTSVPLSFAYRSFRERLFR
jgi:tetratricopeptide (TPR) repeat protein